MSDQGLLTSHSVTPIRICEHRGCGEPISKVAVHLVSSPKGDGLQALIISQLCQKHDAEFLSELRSLYETRPPKFTMLGGDRFREGRHD